MTLLKNWKETQYSKSYFNFHEYRINNFWVKFCTCESCFSRFAVSCAIQHRDETESHSLIWRSGIPHVGTLWDDRRLIRMLLVNRKLTVQTYKLTSALMVLKHLWQQFIMGSNLLASMEGFKAKNQDWTLNNVRNDYSSPETMKIGHSFTGQKLFSQMNTSSHCTRMMEGHPSDVSQEKNSMNPVFWMTGKFGGSGVTVWMPGLILALIILLSTIT